VSVVEKPGWFDAATAREFAGRIGTNKSPWRACSYGTGPRHWYVKREHPSEMLTDKRGNYVRFGSYETAKARADKLNAEEGR
jgi:hypothetical protein